MHSEQLIKKEIPQFWHRLKQTEIYWVKTSFKKVVIFDDNFFIYKSIKFIMKTNIKIILFSVCSILLIFSSCTKEPGCMDPNSMTYNSEAQKEDGSCIYAYDIAQGTWNINPDCEELSIPVIGTISLDDQLPESIEVQGAGDNSLFIDIDGTQVSGDIDNMGNITVNPQTVQID